MAQPRLLLKVLAWGALCLTALAVVAQPRANSEDDLEKKQRVELEVTLPPLPKAGNLIQFEVSAASGSRYFIDAESILVGDDKTVRYTLVIRSASGVDNISYEGMRCDTREQRSYAFGRRDGTWAQPRLSEWREIGSRGSAQVYRELFREYFCPVGGAVRAPKDVVNRLRYGVPIGTPPGGNGR